MTMRSILFVPGDSEKKLAKGASVPADILALDLEDSVTPDNKPEARRRVRNYLEQHGGERRQQLWVRINPVDLPEALDDITSVMPGRPDGIIQPKIRSLSDVTRLSHYLEALEAEYRHPVGSTRIVAVATETAEAMLTMRDYSDMDEPRLAGLIWGAEDLATDLGAATNKAADGDWSFTYRMARSQCLFAATAAGVEAIDTMYGDFRNPEGLQANCDLARQDGFTGKVAIHPDQVAIINAAFTPSDAEVKHSRRVVDAFEDANTGTVSLDGQMLDIPHLKQARRILEVSEQIEA